MSPHSFAAKASQQGGVGVRVIFAAITLLLIGACIGYFLYDYQQTEKENHRKAGRISEYGLQTTLEELSAHPSWKKGFEKTTCDGGWFAVTLHESASNDTVLLHVTSEGHMGSASDRRECILSLAIEGTDSTWIQRSLH